MQSGELLSRILSQYQFFNHILVGAIFTYCLNILNISNIRSESLLVDIILYYAIGIFMSRFASVTIRPLLECIKYIKYSPYPRYVAAVKKDAELDNLSQQNDLFKTSIMTAWLLTVILLVKGHITEDYNITAIITSIIVGLVFTKSYRKQTEYINQRVRISAGRQLTTRTTKSN